MKVASIVLGIILSVIYGAFIIELFNGYSIFDETGYVIILTAIIALSIGTVINLIVGMTKDSQYTVADYEKIRNTSSSKIITSIIAFIFLLVVSEETAAEFFGDVLDLDLADTLFATAIYVLIKQYFLIINALNFAKNIVDLNYATQRVEFLKLVDATKAKKAAAAMQGAAFCTKCGHRLPENAQYCINCGNTIGSAQ